MKIVLWNFEFFDNFVFKSEIILLYLKVKMCEYLLNISINQRRHYEA